MFRNALTVTESPNRQWKLAQGLVYAGHTDTFHVPAGFETDFASVPRAFWSVFPPYGPYTKSAVLHDWLYVTQPAGVSRKDADFAR